MTYERFLQIKEEYKDINLDKTRLWNISSNARCYRSRFSTKGTDDEHWFECLIDKFNADGNEYITNERGIQHIIGVVRCNIFNDDEWKEILPYICFEEFNKDYDELLDRLAPFLGKIFRWRKCLNLEFWQGIFSFGEHWAVEGKTPEESINYKENGEVYCNTLLEMYPIIKDFMSKYPDARHTLQTRLGE